jgi:hypothetical protein
MALSSYLKRREEFLEVMAVELESGFRRRRTQYAVSEAQLKETWIAFSGLDIGEVLHLLMDS